MVTPEVQPGHLASVVRRFQGFRHDQVLEHRAAQRMTRELTRIADSQQPAKQSRIDEVQLRAACQPAVVVAVVWQQPEGDEAGLQHGEPAPYGVSGDAAVVRQTREVQQLAGPPGAEHDEAVETLEIAHLGELPYVPLEIGLVVTGQPLARFELPVVDAREVTAPGMLRPAAGAGGSTVRSREFAHRERHQVGHADPPRQGLRNACHQEEVLRAGQDEAARDRVVVRQDLDVGEEVRRPLRLVQDRGSGKPSEEPPRVFEGESPLVRRLQRHVVEVREGRAQECRLA